MLASSTATMTAANGHVGGQTAPTGPVPLLIDGKETKSSITFDVVSPGNGELQWQASSVSAEQAVQAVEAAQRAFKTWRRTKPAEIRNIFLKAAEIMETRADELKGYMKEETGALDTFCSFNISTTLEILRDVAGRTSTIHGAIPQTATPGTGAFIFKEPYGVNFGIAPWNAPYILGGRAFAYAVATGNTVVLKGSELSPRCFWALGSVMQQAGLPAGVLNVIFHRPADAVAVTNAVIEHPLVKKVNFTGSTAVGSIIAAKAGKELKPVVMELGGKASAIVCEDAEIEPAAAQVAFGAFLHAGQVCMATERVLVHRAILEPFAAALKQAVEKVYAGSADAPLLVAKAGVEKNRKLLEDAVSKGAKPVYGDVGAKEQSAHRMRPIIVTDINKDMDIFYTESFGPTVSLIPIDSDDEAIDIANDTEYGLSGAIFTASLARGLKIAKEIDSGAVHINSMTIQ